MKLLRGRREEPGNEATPNYTSCSVKNAIAEVSDTLQSVCYKKALQMPPTSNTSTDKLISP